ncbi:phosphatidate cytidylyltransferase [Occultella gossypii]|uniref:Phosphatidate cytidylyltransferase n=1 Tax=Occultella gossypii TaxID=2800820 RepID=A0ABS7S6H5_9MICO|nr:phosphatidate cytidylyltransferase [Occultella gossypii]MBZ2195959.1 phosphatidate cytidylyltransferase [Occultella gossypii]
MVDPSPPPATGSDGAPLSRRALRAAERAARLEAELDGTAADAEPSGPAAAADRAATTGRADKPAPLAARAGSSGSAASPEPATTSPNGSAGSAATPSGSPADPATGTRGAAPDRLTATPGARPTTGASTPSAEPAGSGDSAASAASAEEPAPASRAGRNLPAAIGVGLGLGAVLIASLFIRKEAFVVLAVVACAIALWELERALRTRDIRLPYLPLVVGTVGMLVSAYQAGIEALLVAFLLTAGGVFVWRVLDGGGGDALRDATAGIFAAAYIPFLAGFLMIMLSADDGQWRVLMFVALVVANDTGGYIAGVLFGRHPMAPSVSPKKSWEGAAGSVVLAALVGVGFAIFAIDATWWAGLAIGVVAVAGATMGDLSESMLKRDLGVKDMGKILPGHGGILDRVDSILICSPVVFALLLVVAPA